MDADIRTLNKDMDKIKGDIELIKNVLSEGELTDWAKEELEKARKIPDSENIPLEEVEKRIQEK